MADTFCIMMGQAEKQVSRSPGAHRPVTVAYHRLLMILRFSDVLPGKVRTFYYYPMVVPEKKMGSNIKQKYPNLSNKAY